MAKNKKKKTNKKEVEKQYGSGIAPVLVKTDDKFTIKTPNQGNSIVDLANAMSGAVSNAILQAPTQVNTQQTQTKQPVKQQTTKQTPTYYYNHNGVLYKEEKTAGGKTKTSKVNDWIEKDQVLSDKTLKIEKRNDRKPIFEEFKNGYQFGDITKSIGNLVTDYVLEPVEVTSEEMQKDPMQTLKTLGTSIGAGTVDTIKSARNTYYDFMGWLAGDKNLKQEQNIFNETNEIVRRGKKDEINNRLGVIEEYYKNGELSKTNYDKNKWWIKYNQLDSSGTKKEIKTALIELEEEYKNGDFDKTIYESNKTLLNDLLKQNGRDSETFEKDKITQNIEMPFRTSIEDTETYKKYESGELTEGQQNVWNVGAQMGQQVPSMVISSAIPVIGSALGKTFFWAQTQDSYYNEAKQRGYNDTDARKYSIILSSFETLIEEREGINPFGGVDEVAKEGLAKAISGEAFEEFITPYFDYYVRTKFGEEYDLDAATQEAIEGAVSAAWTTLIMSSSSKGLVKVDEAANKIKNGKQITTEELLEAAKELEKNDPNTKNKINKMLYSLDTTPLTENENKVVEDVLEQRIEEEYNGEISNKEKKQLKKEIQEDLRKGYISTDTIEKSLGGETYTKLDELNKQQTKLQKQIDDLEKKAKNNELSSLEEKQKLEDLKKQIKQIDNTQIKNQLTSEVQDIIKNDKGLRESYLENQRRGENFFVDLNTIKDETQRAVYRKAMETGVLNNSNKTHALVDMIAKISSDKNIDFNFTNNEQLEKSGFGVNGRNINGYVTDSGITINLNSQKAINRIVGHELTHTFEGTTLYTELQDNLKDFLGSEWDNQVAKYKELYKGVKNANIENELTSDLIGDYLFTDENYVKNLSTKNKNLFEKVYDEIKYLYNVATAGSREKRQLEKVKRTFDRIYNETESKVTTEENAKYSISEDSQGRKLSKQQQEYFKNSKVVDENGKLIPLYHGTRNDFTVFDINKSGQSNSTASKVGFWFTESQKGAEEFSNSVWYGENEKAKTMEVYLDLENPKIYEKVDNNKKIEQLKEQRKENQEQLNKIYEKYDIRHDIFTGQVEQNTFDTISRYKDAPKSEIEQAIREWAKADNVEEYYNDILKYRELNEKNKAIEKELEDLRFTDSYEQFRSDIYKEAGARPMDANFGGTGMALEDPDGTVKKYIDKLKEQGYDGIIIKGTNYDNNRFGENNNQYVAFYPNQIKNVDNTNPTSNADIRYDLSVSEAKTKQDNEGRKLTKDQLSYFKDTKAVDNDGNLITVYHTTTKDVAQFNEFNPVGTDYYKFGDQVVNYYTNSKTMSGSYADYEYQMADTSKITNKKGVNDILVEINNKLNGDRIFVIETNDNGTYFLYDKLHKNNHLMTKFYKSQEELFKNIKQDLQERAGFREKTQYEGYVNITNPYIIDAKEANWDSILTGYDEMSVRYANEISQEDKQELIDLAKESKRRNDAIYDELKELYSEEQTIKIKYPYTREENYKERLTKKDYNQWQKIQNRIEEIKSKQHYEDDYFKENVGELQDKINNELNMNYSDYDLYRMANTEFEKDNLKRIFGRTETTNDIVKYVLDRNKQGDNYDGVIIKNVIDYGNTTEFDDNGAAQDVYVTFNSNQFKAADNTNPTIDPDIRYSLSQDSQGRELSEGQQEYFRDSKVRDDNGNLMPVYHASRGNQFTVFDKNKGYNIDAFYFTKDSNVASHWSKNGEYVVSDESYNSIKNQINNAKNYQELIDIVNSNNFGYKLSIENGRIEQVYDGGAETSSPMKSFDKLKQDVEYNLMSQKYSGDIYKEYLNITNPLVVDAKNQPYHSVEFEGKKLNTETIASIAKERGYDGVIVKNVYETDYENRLTDDYIAFNSNQVKNIDNLNPTSNDDIRYSLDIAPISKNFLTESEQDELDGLRAVENSGFAELTPEEQSRMMELENRANKVLDKKAEKMLRSASYKAINTSTKIAENYLDFDAKQKKEFRSQMREFSNMTKDELVNANTYNKVRDIVSQYANKEYTYFDDNVEGIKRELKHTKIQVSDELKNQITDYGDFVKDSKLMLRRNSGQNVDTVYQEYSNMYPGFFDDSIMSEADQLEALNDFVNHDFSVTEKYKLTDEDLRNATDLIYNKLLDNSLTQQDLIETEEILDKKAQKRTRSVVREELLQKMGITPETIQAGNDISAISFARTDPIRVNEKVFGWETGQKINDATVNFTKHQEAERIRFLNKERQEIKDLGIKARSKESELVQKYGEKQYIDKNNEVHEYGDAELERDVKDAVTREKIKNAARVLRQKYDTYIDRVNAVLTEMGYDEIPKRKDYMRHFVELDDKFSRWGLPFNKESMSAEDLPTDINGLTEFNRPGKSYFASANTRTGLQTTYDAITGIDGYLEGVSNLIYHTESIQRYRALTRLIRENYGREHGFDNIDLMTDEELADRIKDIQDNKLSKYVAWLDEQANSIAGKKGALDRSVERMFGRRIYTALNTLKSQVGSNMTGFNVRSAMTNFASAIQGMSKTQKLAFAKGTISTINNIIHNDGMIEKSDFLTRRLLNTDSLAMKPWQKLTQAGQVFMNGTDYFTANQIWRSKYFENLQKGMSEEQAIKNADDFAARIMGDRSKGSTAELFNSKTLGFLSQFQLEVNNQWSSLIHDNKIDIQKGDKTALGVTFELGQLFAASYMFNSMMKSLTGSDVMIDPIDMLLKIFKPDDDDDEDDIVKRAQKVLGEFINQLPFANLITGGGRIPISEAFTGVQTLGKKLMGGTDNYGNEITWGDVKDDALESAAYWLLPTGYGQIRKTTKGLSMYDDKLPIAGSYTDSGNLRFSAEDTTLGKIKAGLFGQYSSKYAQDYIKSGYKSINASKLDEMKDLDMNSTEYRNYREGLSAAGTSVEDKLDYINSLDVPYADKDIMASNVAKKDIDMKEYNKYGSYEEFNYAQKNPAKYQVMKYIGGYDTYKNYEKEINDIKADYDRNGKAITNSRKNKVIKYVNSLNLTKAQKAMLIKEQYPSFTKYDKEIASYINSQNIRYIEKASILKQLGFTAYDRQIINYIKQNYRTVEEQQEELEKLGFKVYNYNGKTYVR